MNHFSWTKAIFFGIFIWAVLFVVGLLLAAMAVTVGTGALLALAIIAAFVTYGFAMSANPSTTMQALGYGVSWVVVGLLLDVLISRQLAPNIFNAWSYWLGYLFILVTPVVRVPSSQHAASAV